MRRAAEKGRRGRRVANVIRQIVSETLLTDMNDPRLGFLTVTDVELSEDLRFADVRISVMGDDPQRERGMRTVRHAPGRLQDKVADGLDLKFCPALRFHLDESVRRSVALSELISRARAEDEAARAERIRRGVESPDETRDPNEIAPETPEKTEDEPPTD